MYCGVRFHGRQSSSDRLCTKRKEAARNLKSFKEVYDEMKTRMACYMATSIKEWIMAAWRNKIYKKQASLKREAKKAMGNVSATVSFYEGSDKER